MACKNIGKLCKHLVISNSVTYTSGVLIINLPAGSYVDGEKYCIVIAQEIPTTTIIGATVVITIGNSPTTYPLTNNDCTNVSACQLVYRKRYATRVHTNIGSGVFKLLGNTNCECCSARTSRPALQSTLNENVQSIVQATEVTEVKGGEEF